MGERRHARDRRADDRLHRRRVALADRDEFLRPDTTLEGLAQLPTPFRPGGRVTAGNSAGLTDGADASLLASEDTVAELGLEPKLRLVSFAFAGVEPELMGSGRCRRRAGARRGRPHPRRHRPLRAERAVRGAGAELVRRARSRPEDDRVSTRTAARSPAAIRSPRPACGCSPSSPTGCASAAARYGLTALCVGMGMGARSSGRTSAERHRVQADPERARSPSSRSTTARTTAADVLRPLGVRVARAVLAELEQGDWSAPS